MHHERKMVVHLFKIVTSAIVVVIISTSAGSDTPEYDRGLVQPLFTPSCEAGSTDPHLSMIRVPPIYPKEAAKKRLEGWVIVRFDVTDNGATENIRIVESDRGEIFERPVIDAVEKWIVYTECPDMTVGGTKDVEEKIEFRLE